VPEHDVRELVVAVDDARPVGLRFVGPEPRGGLVEPGEVAELARGQVREPAVDLPFVEPLGLPETLEPARLPVDARELRDRLDELEREPAAGREVGVERRRPAVRAHARPPVDEFHQVEGGADDVDVVARGEDARVRDVGVLERGEHAVLAQHRLVPALRHLARRAAERQARVAAPDLEQLVRGAARDEIGLEGRARAGEALRVHPARELLAVDEPAHAVVVGVGTVHRRSC
jgi:hypothetical protein